MGANLLYRCYPFLFLLNYLMGQPFALSKHSCNLFFVLFIQAKTPNRAVENGVFHYPVGPFVFRVTAAFRLLQLASSDVNLTCGVINKFSISNFNSWVPLGLGLWLK